MFDILIGKKSNPDFLIKTVAILSVFTSLAFGTIVVFFGIYINLLREESWKVIITLAPLLVVILAIYCFLAYKLYKRSNVARIIVGSLAAVGLPVVFMYFWAFPLQMIVGSFFAIITGVAILGPALQLILLTVYFAFQLIGKLVIILVLFESELVRQEFMDAKHLSRERFSSFKVALLVFGIIAMVFLGLLLVGFIHDSSYQGAPQGQIQNNVDGIDAWNTYGDQVHGFQFEYPIENVSKNGIYYDTHEFRLPIAGKDIHTNIDAKVLHLVVVDNANSCGNPISNQQSNVTVNGIPFIKGVGGEGAAGRSYYYENYSTVKDGDCVSMNFVISSFNNLQIPVENGSSDKPFVQYDIAKEAVIFNEVMSTFKFTK